MNTSNQEAHIDNSANTEAVATWPEDERRVRSWADHASAAEAWERQHEVEWARVDGKLRGIAARRAALDAEEANLLRYAEELKLWRGFACGSMIEYMERAMGYAPHTAAERLRVARAIAELPLITEALERGELPHSAVRELSRVAVPDTEAAWLEAARGKSLREIEALVSGRRPGHLLTDETEPRLHRKAITLEVRLGSLDAAAPERATTTVTPRKREQVLARDGHCCAVPGCRRNIGLDLHHIEYQSRGGGHELSNLTTLCDLHHRAVHFGKLLIRGTAPDRMTFTFHRPRDRRNVTDDDAPTPPSASSAAPPSPARAASPPRISQAGPTREQAPAPAQATAAHRPRSAVASPALERTDEPTGSARSIAAPAPTWAPAPRASQTAFARQLAQAPSANLPRHGAETFCPRS